MTQLDDIFAYYRKKRKEELKLKLNEKPQLKTCTFCNKSNKTALSRTLNKYICKPCYKKRIWKQKLVKCKNCGRERPMHGRGLCHVCYQAAFSLDKVHAGQKMRKYNLDAETYNKITKQCALCGFDKVIDLHHLDHNRKNNAPTNLVGLCPNHHRMLHDRKYQKEIFEALKQKGFKVPEGFPGDFFYKKE